MRQLSIIARLGISLTFLAGQVIAETAPTANNTDTSVFTAGVTVMTDKGLVEGEAKTNHRQFLGLPYASPPIGKHRWAPPQSVQPWSNVLDASAFRSQCLQVFLGVQGSEDCLYLNVYTPNPSHGRDRELKPVMVWFHGGGWAIGASQDSDASFMAVKGDVVVVTVNYRLGAFGFYASTALDAENKQGVSGNYALLDEQAALRWVKRNIRAFGGDPNQITVAGESAGAISGWLHLVSPASAGLFHRMIAQSGPLPIDPPPGTEWTRGLGGTRPLHIEQTQGSSASLAPSLGCSQGTGGLACLRSKSAQDILTAAGPGSWGPVVDGILLPDSVPQLLKRGLHQWIPILTGNNRGEGSFNTLLRLASGGRPLTASEYRDQTLARPNGSQILAEYPATNYSSPDDAANQNFDDVYLCSAMLRSAKLLAPRLPLYLYQFQDDHPPATLFDVSVPPDIHPRAFHTAEITYVFQSGYPGILRPGPPPFTPTQAMLSDRMIRYWSNFMKTGKPGQDWKSFSHTNSLLALRPEGDVPMTAQEMAAQHHCGFWDAL